MLDVDECSQTPPPLGLRDYGERERRFPGRFRPKNLDHSSARKPAYTQRSIDQDIAGRNDLDVCDLLITQPHDRPIAVVFCDLLNRQVEILVSGGD